MVAAFCWCFYDALSKIRLESGNARDGGISCAVGVIEWVFLGFSMIGIRGLTRVVSSC